MANDPNCTFCKIIAKELPSEEIYEDSHVVVILDINPVNPGHLLVIPKDHSPDFISTPEEILHQIVTAAKKVAEPMMKATGATAFNIAVNNGHDAGQAVMHTHMHVIPRHHNDGHKMWTQKPYPDGGMDEMRSKIHEQMELDGTDARL